MDDIENKIETLQNENDSLRQQIQTDQVQNSENSELRQTVVDVLNEFNVCSGEYCGDWVGATIEKLPLWGQ